MEVWIFRNTPMAIYPPLSESLSHTQCEFKGHETNIVGRARSRALKTKQPPSSAPSPPLSLHIMSGPKKTQTTTVQPMN